MTSKISARGNFGEMLSNRRHRSLRAFLNVLADVPL